MDLNFHCIICIIYSIHTSFSETQGPSVALHLPKRSVTDHTCTFIKMKDQYTVIIHFNLMSNCDNLFSSSPAFFIQLGSLPIIH